MSHNMSLAEMRKQVYFLADEKVSSVFPSDRTDACINAGLARVARLTGVPRVTTSGTTLPGVSAYPLTSPEGMDIDPKMVEDEPVVFSITFNGKTLNPTPKTDTIPPGTPTGYWFVESTLYLKPSPTVAGTLEVSYEPEINYLASDGDISTLPYEAQELACIYAASLLKEKDDEYNAADRLMAQFNNGLRDLVGPLPGVYKAV